jgi:AraC-like DNA-binding protein
MAHPGLGSVGKRVTNDDAGAAFGRPVPDVRFHLPAPELRDLITAYVIVESTLPLCDFLHPEWANVRFVLWGEWEIQDLATGAMVPAFAPALFGPTDRTRQFSSPAGGLLGVGLTPLGWVRLIGGNAGAVANKVVPLGDGFGTDGVELAAALRACTDDACRVALLDRTLIRRSRHGGKQNPLALRAHDVLVSGSAADVAEFAEQLDIQPAKLSRLCLRVFGFTPKRLLRRQRFLRTLGAVRNALDQPLTELIDPAYYDQAHFNRDFKAFMGTSPRAYFKSPREVLRRAIEERLRVVGAPVQGLHPLKRNGENEP